MKKFAGDTTECESGWIESEDTTCRVMCDCGNRIDDVVSCHRLTRCPNCGKGYRTEFVVWQYDTNEKI